MNEINGTNNFYPLVHGDWHVIDGQLVDMKTHVIEAGTSKEAHGDDTSDPQPHPASSPSSSPAGHKRHKRNEV